MDTLTEAILQLPKVWHGSGHVTPAVLAALERHAAGAGYTVETGCGKSTLLLSHFSQRHTVFVRDDLGGSRAVVESSDLLKNETVEFVVGPTQQTLLGYEFDEPIDLALIDGPHAYPFPDLEYWAIYPHLRAGAVLVVDDLQIPTIGNLYRFLCADDMFELAETVDNTAFFIRTDAKTHDPFGDEWWEQKFNVQSTYPHLTWPRRLERQAKQRVPPAAKQWVRERLERAGRRRP